MAGAYRYSFSDVGGAMVNDEALNGMAAAPYYAGGMPNMPAAMLGTPGVTAAAVAPPSSAGLGSGAMLLWAGLLVLLVLSHTMTLEVQE